MSIKMKTLRTFDEQMRCFEDRLRNLGLSEWQLRKPASCVYEEVTHFHQGLRSDLRNSSPVNLRERLSEIEWFIYFNAKYGSLIPDPGFARAYTVISNYVSFVYPGNTVYRILAENSPSDSVSHSVGQFLRSERLRGFRHALAHGHWTISADGSGIQYWPQPRSSPLDVAQNELVYWYTVARATAYAALAGAEHDVA